MISDKITKDWFYSWIKKFQKFSYFKKTPTNSTSFLPYILFVRCKFYFNLNDSEFIILLFGLFVQYCHKTSYKIEWLSPYSNKQHVANIASTLFALSVSALFISLKQSMKRAQLLNITHLFLGGFLLVLLLLNIVQHQQLIPPSPRPNMNSCIKKALLVWT